MLVPSGDRPGGKAFKIHLDGYNLIPALKGETKEWPRKEMLYWSDDGDLMALRYDKWKLHFVEQRAEGFNVWREPFVKLRVPLIFNLRADPFEKAQHESIYHADWMAHRVFVLVPAQLFVAKWISSFKEFPPRAWSGQTRARPLTALALSPCTVVESSRPRCGFFVGARFVGYLTQIVLMLTNSRMPTSDNSRL
jgi:hypothetical protein